MSPAMLRAAPKPLTFLATHALLLCHVLGAHASPPRSDVAADVSDLEEDLASVSGDLLQVDISPAQSNGARRRTMLQQGSKRGSTDVQTASTHVQSGPQGMEEALRRVGDGRVYLEGTKGVPLTSWVKGRALAACPGVLAPPPPPARPPAPPTPSGPPPPPVPMPTPVTVTIKTGRAYRYPISRGIYGFNENGQPGDRTIGGYNKAAGVRLIRRGGNPFSRYNWAIDTKNHASDWFFENIPCSFSNAGNRRANNSVHVMVDLNKWMYADTLVTIPMLWLPKWRNHTCSFSISKYGKQQSADSWFCDCGNGVAPSGGSIANNPQDQAVNLGPDHQYQWVRSLVQKYGPAANGGIKYYCLDNEPVWWAYLHRDVHPSAASYDEILQKGIAFASAVKKADPTARVSGPVSGGWSDYFYSFKDMQSGWGTAPAYQYWSNPVDRLQHGNTPFLQWYLQGMAQYERQHGQRILDILDVHGYFAGPAGSDASDPGTQAMRIAATRILWDPTFKCWFCDFTNNPAVSPDGIPRVFPRLWDMIHAAYPGTGLAYTEYSFGGRKDVSGAIAQAEALGVFGLMNLTLAAVFTGPGPDSSTYWAFRMFGNYDGQGSRFGSLGVSAVSSKRNSLSCYGAMDLKRRVLTVLVINLQPFSQLVTISLADVIPRWKIRVFRYSAQHLTAIVPLPSKKPTRQLVDVYPGYTLTMLEVPIY